MSHSKKFSKAEIHDAYWRSCAHEGYLNIYIYRKLAIYCALAAARLGISPNQVTLLSFAASLVACIMFVPGDYTLWLWALIPFHIGKILDCADGMLAKLTGQTSAYGAFLDPFIDRIVDTATLTALAVGFFAHTGNPVAIYILVAVLSAWYISAYLNSQTEKEHGSLQTLRSGTSGLPPALRRLAKWDGGFTGLVTSVAVIWVQIPALLVLFLAVGIAPIPLQYKAIHKRLQQS